MIDGDLGDTPLRPSMSRRAIIRGMAGLAAGCVLGPATATAESRAPQIRRLGTMIRREMLPPEDRDNINGPSVIRTPDWIPNPLGRFMMYFAHHGGTYIRLAFAEDPAGPWSIHPGGSLHLHQCKPFVWGHIASPDVHVDPGTRQIIMYFHGPARGPPRKQSTFVATSHDGIDFKPRRTILGPFYFRVWAHGDHWYALAKGQLFRSRNRFAAFEPGHSLLVHDPNFSGTDGGIRHAAVDVRGDTLVVYYSRHGDAPEHIVRATLDMRRPWSEWRLENETSVIMPDLSQWPVPVPVRPSVPGDAGSPIREVRDPCVFVHSGRTFLYYSANGEHEIEAVELL